MFDGIKAKRFCRQAAALKDGMYALAISILGEESDAEQAIQNTLRTAHARLDELGFLESFKPWILKLLTRECCRIASMRPSKVEKTPKDGRSAWDAVCGLGPAYRDVMVLYYCEDLKTADIAKILDISDANVCQRLSVARTSLQQKENGEMIS